MMLILALLMGNALADTAGDKLAAQALSMGFSPPDAQLLKADADRAIAELAPYREKSLQGALPASVGKVLDDVVLLGSRYDLTADQVLTLVVEFAVGINEVSNAPDPAKIRKAFVPMQHLFAGKSTPGPELLRLYGPMLKEGLADNLALEPARRTTPPSKGMAASLRTARKITDFAKKNGVPTTDLLAASRALETGMR